MVPDAVKTQTLSPMNIPHALKLGEWEEILKLLEPVMNFIPVE
jgi:hypothetical protein